MRIHKCLPQSGEPDGCEIRVGAVHNLFGFVKGHESLVHLLTILELSGAHHAFKIATCAQLEHQIGGMWYFCIAFTVEPQPFDMI